METGDRAFERGADRTTPLPRAKASTVPRPAARYRLCVRRPQLQHAKGNTRIGLPKLRPAKVCRRGEARRCGHSHGRILPMRSRRPSSAGRGRGSGDVGGARREAAASRRRQPRRTCGLRRPPERARDGVRQPDKTRVAPRRVRSTPTSSNIWSDDDDEALSVDPESIRPLRRHPGVLARHGALRRHARAPEEADAEAAVAEATAVGVFSGHRRRDRRRPHPPSGA